MQARMKTAMLGFILLTSVALTACDQSGSASNVNTPSAVSSTNQCTAPSTRALNYGVRATTGTTMGLRGAFSDIAQIPGTTSPGVVYTDAGAVALKYSFWNGVEFKDEVIAGGLTTSFVRLVYLSNGKPLVFWANGATRIYMAARSTAALDEVGTWKVTPIETVLTMTTRAVEASVNANDQVAVFYISAVGTVARLILCSSNCDEAANYSGMGAITNGISLTASASTNSADVKWCNAGGNVYYPYVVFGGTTNSLIARCTNSTLANCLVPANWASAAVTDGTNATGANQVFAKMHIDSTVDAPFAVVAKRLTGTEIRAYEQSTGGCSTGPLAFHATSRSIATGATLGNAFGNLQKDSSNRWHLLLNDSTTSLRYYNHTSGLGVTTAWNPVSITETTTIGAPGATRSSMLVDEAGDQVLLTYGRTAAGTPAQTLGNLVLSYNNCTLGNTGCTASTLGSPSGSAGMTFGNMPVNSTGQISLTTGQFPQVLSMAATTTGRPAVAFVDFSSGAATTGRLKYSLRSGTSASNDWPDYELGSAVSPQAVDLAFDHLNRPWIAYYDANSLRYFLTTNSQTDGSGTWSTYQFPIGVTVAPTLPAVNNISLAMSYSNGVARPLMIVSNSGSATKVIRAAVFTPTTETWSLNQQLDTGVANFANLSSDFDTKGNVVVAAYDVTNNLIRYVSSTDGGTTWSTVASIVSALGGTGLSIKLNPTTQRPAITFYDRAVNLVRYKHCNAALASCVNPTNWVNLGVGILESVAGVNGLTAAATDGLLHASLTFSAEGYPWVAYSTGASSDSADLKLTSVNPALGFFATGSSIATGAFATSTAPAPATPANFGAGGWQPVSVRTATGALHTAYIGKGNHLFVTSCGD